MSSGGSVGAADLDVWGEVVLSMGSRFVGVLLRFVHVFMVVLLLGQEDVGVFFVLLAVVYLFGQVASGVAKAVLKRVSERDSGRVVYGWGGLVLILVALVVCWVGLVVVSVVFGEWVPFSVGVWEIGGIVFVSFWFGVGTLMEKFVSGCGRPALVEKIKTFGGRVGMIVVTGVVLSVWSSAVAALVSYSVLYILLIVGCVVFAPVRGFSWPSVGVIRELGVFCKWSVPTSLLNDFYFRWDTFLLGVMVGVVAVSYYDSVVRVVTFGSMLYASAGVVGNVKISGLFESGEDVLGVARDIVGVSGLITFGMVLVALFNAEFVLGVVFGDEYVGASLFFVLMAVTQLFHGFRVQFEAVFNGVDYPRGTTWISFVVVVVNVISAPFFVLVVGGIGVVVSTLLAECVRFWLYQRSLYDLLNGVVVSWLLGVQVVGVVVVSGLLAVIQTMSGIDGSEMFLVTVVFGLPLFYVFSYVFSTRLREIVGLTKEQITGF